MRGRVVWLLVFLAVSCALLVLTARIVAQATYEAADFAADSLLVQVAKSQILLTGNYSRVGFHHPGPALIYVLTFGEVVFHDLLRLTSPIGGQMVAVIFYSAAWTGLLALMATRLFGDVLTVVVFVSAALAGVAYYDSWNLMTLALMPEMYCLPFAVFTMALGLAITGRNDVLWILAVSAGFLINGHVCFVPIVGIMLLIGLGANLLIGEPLALRSVLRAALIGSLFLMPLAIRTVTEWPGPIAAYIGFGKGQAAHGWRESIDYVTQYFGGGLPAFGWLATLVLATIGLGWRATGLAVAFLAATLATLIYARYGIDHLEHSYIAKFYGMVPVLIFAIMCAALAVWWRWQWWRVIPAALGCAGALCYWGWRATHAPPHQGFYTDNTVPGLYEKMASVAPMPYALDLDAAEQFGAVWSNALAVQIYAMRRGVNPFCIAKHWQISHMESTRCTDAQLATRLHFMLAWARPRSDVGEPVARSGVLAVYRLD